MAGLKRQGPVMAYGCFCISDMLKYIYFSPIFPLMGSIIEHFIGYSYLKKESINRFP